MAPVHIGDKMAHVEPGGGGGSGGGRLGRGRRRRRAYPGREGLSMGGVETPAVVQRSAAPWDSRVAAKCRAFAAHGCGGVCGRMMARPFRDGGGGGSGARVL